MNAKRDSSQPAVATLVIRHETIEVLAVVNLSGFEPMLGDFTPERARLRAWVNDKGIGVSVTFQGRTPNGSAQGLEQQTGEYTAPHRTTEAPQYDPYQSRYGHVEDLPVGLRHALEEATGVRFADYGVPDADR